MVTTMAQIHHLALSAIRALGLSLLLAGALVVCVVGFALYAAFLAIVLPLAAIYAIAAARPGMTLVATSAVVVAWILAAGKGG